MSSPTVVPCRRCGAQGAPATITMQGPYCKYCYTHHLVPLDCCSCGRRTRAEPRARSPRCRTCRNALDLVKKRCALCKRRIQNVQKNLPDGGVIGQCCYHKVRPHKLCEYCRKPTRLGARAPTFGIKRLACPRCLRRRLPICPSCHQRARIYPTPDRGTLCRKCAHGPLQRFPCIECGRLSYRLSHGRCSFHAARFTVPRLAERLGRSLHRPWVRAAFIAYTNVLLDRVDGSRSIPGYLRRDLGLFAHLDRHFHSPADLTNVRLAEVMGPKEINRYRRACGYLVSSGLIASMSEAEVEWAMTAWRIRELRRGLQSTWCQSAFDAFHAHLLERRALLLERGHQRTREPMTPRGVLSALYGAAHLLQTADRRGSIGVQDITHRDIQSLLSRTKLNLNRLGRFIAYLNAETPRFHRLKLPKVGGNHGLPDGLLGTEDFDSLVQKLLRAESPRDQVPVLVSLLCLLYGQAPARIMRLKRHQVRLQDGSWEIQFARAWIPLHPDVNERMVSWMRSRREISVVEATNTSPYLFPGRRAGSPMTTEALHSWLQAYGIKPQQLQSSGLSQMVQSEDFHPSMATDSLGLTRTVVAKYMKLLTPANLRQIQDLVPEQ